MRPLLAHRSASLPGMTEPFDRTRPAREWPIPPMDKGSGDKDTAFTWAMGNLILQRIADGDTMKQITADPRMPAYCTVFRWMHVVPQFGEAVEQVRRLLADSRKSYADAARRVRGRRRRGGQRERVSADALDAALGDIRDGASTGEAVAASGGAVSAKTLYSRVRKCPGFRLAFEDACWERDFWLAMERERVIDRVAATGIPAANAALRALDARRGRLRPKLYRRADRAPE